MNLLNKCTEKQLKLLEQAGINLVDKDYTNEELKMCETKIVEYIMSKSLKEIDELRDKYSSIFRIIDSK